MIWGENFTGIIWKDLVGSVLRMKERFLGQIKGNLGDIGLGAKTGKDDDEGEIEVDGDEEDTI